VDTFSYTWIAGIANEIIIHNDDDDDDDDDDDNVDVDSD